MSNGKTEGLSKVEGSLVWGGSLGITSGLIYAIRNGHRAGLYTGTKILGWTATMALYYGAKDMYSWTCEAATGRSFPEADVAIGAGGIMGSVIGVYKTTQLPQAQKVEMSRGGGGFLRMVGRHAAMGVGLALVINLVDEEYIKWKMRQALALNRPDLAYYASNPQAPEMDPINPDRDWFLDMLPRWARPISDPKKLRENKLRLAQVENELRLVDLKIELHRRGLDFIVPEEVANGQFEGEGHMA